MVMYLDYCEGGTLRTAIDFEIHRGRKGGFAGTVLCCAAPDNVALSESRQPTCLVQRDTVLGAANYVAFMDWSATLYSTCHNSPEMCICRRDHCRVGITAELGRGLPGRRKHHARRYQAGQCHAGLRGYPLGRLWPGVKMQEGRDPDDQLFLGPFPS